MGLKLESANTVIRGNFNPFIFSPEWLKAQGIWDTGEVHLALGAVVDGIRFRSPDSRVEWQVDNKSMAITSVSDSALLAGRVLRALPHTPVSAIGVNFTYASEKWDSPTVPLLGEKSLTDLPQKWNPEIMSWSGVFHLEDIRIAMTVACGSEGISVTFNHHKSVVSATEAAAIADRFAMFRGESEKMISEILGGNVE